MRSCECPTCGKKVFTNKSYMKKHHKLVHGESLREEYECSIDGCNNKSYNPKFCSQECLGKARRKYEKTSCKNPNCDNQVYKFDYCSHNCANKTSWKYRDNAAKRPEVRKKIAEAKKGQTFEMSEESKKKISEAMSGENHPLHGKTGKDHPKYGKLSGLKLQKVEETGHRVRSNWEKKIDLMLHKWNLDYEYEPKTFELTDKLTYTPDFIVEDIVIEVKGWPNKISKKRAKIFMEEHPELTYLVIGNKVPNDIFIDWDNKGKLIEEIRNVKDSKEPLTTRPAT